MSDSTPAAPAVASASWVNTVCLRGRLSAAPTERRLPSGESLWSFRVVVPRAEVAPRRAKADALECAVWSGRLRRSMAMWREGDEVEVSGSLRRRFFRVGGSSVSRVEVEVHRGRIIRRADCG